MFCKNCGARLSDDAVFCHKCGWRVEHDDGQVKEYDPWQLNTLAGSLNAFRSASAAYSALAPYADRLAAAREERAKLQEPSRSKGFVGFLIPGAILTCLGLFILFIKAILSINDLDLNATWVVPIVILLAGGAFLTVGFLKLKPMNAEYAENCAKYAQRKQELDNNIAAANDALIGEANNHPVLTFFPEEFFDPYTIQRGIELLETRQADSYKEALKLCQDEQHRARMEGMQQEMLDAQYRMVNEAAAARRAATMSAVFSGISAINSIRN